MNRKILFYCETPLLSEINGSAPESIKVERIFGHP